MQVLHGLPPPLLVSRAYNAAASQAPIRLLRVDLRKLSLVPNVHEKRLTDILDSIKTPIIKVQWVLPDSHDDKAVQMLCNWIKVCKHPESIQTLKIFDWDRLPLDSVISIAREKLPACKVLILPNRPS